ncbi:MAG: TRAP transporter small permease [Gemmobacter sp.]
MLNTYARFLGVFFGASMILLSVLIAVETIVRKSFSVSLGGVDEWGGYAMAIGAPIAFAVALVEQAHIRINLLHQRLSRRTRAVLNAVSMLSMGILSLYLLYFTVKTVIDTQTYRSIAQTPMATPLIYPQSIWLVAMALFALTAVLLTARALILLAGRDWAALNQQFGPASAQEELDAELEDAKKRKEMEQ